MHLKKVHLENFKSFGSKIDIPFEKGYTNITGPNGSGKSNISDAILFVLGPKSSKEMRAGRLTDLIFNGGKEGKPADFCRVSLTFENKDRTIPRNDDEVTFTRKVQKSDNNMGYNSYFYLNGRSSSLTEFQELLSHAKIAAGGYNLVQQGDISRIVEMSDYERRGILEDISGISDYDKDIEDAEEKKEDVRDDLDRINLILDELGRQVEELEEDRKDALKYQELSDRIKESKSMKDWKEREELQADLTSIEEDIDKNKEKINEIDGKKEEIKQTIHELEDELKEIEKELEDKGSDESKKLRDKVNELKLTRYRAEDMIESCEKKLKDNEDIREELREELKKNREELTDKKKSARKIKEKLDVVEEELESVKEKKGSIEEKQSASNDRIVELKKEGVKLRKEFEEKDEERRELHLELDKIEDKIERIVEDISEIEEEHESLQFEKKELKWKLKEARKNNREVENELKELKKKFHDARKNEKRLQDDKEDLEKRVDRLDREYNHLKAQEEAAKSVRRGYSRAVSKILEARDKGELEGIHGTIAEIADVDKQYETALQVSAGGRMQSIVVDDDARASEAIDYLKRNKAGRATFLPLNKMMSGRPRGKAISATRDDDAVDFAINLVDYEDKYDNVFWYVFGDTVVMKDIESARRLMGGVRMVTLDGEKIERSGAMVGGTLRQNMISFEAPDRGKLDRIGKELQASRENLSKVKKEIKEIQSEMNEYQDKIRNIRAEGGIEKSTDELEGELGRLNKKLNDKNSRLEKKKKEKEGLEIKFKEKENQCKSLEETIERLKGDRNDITEKIESMTPEELSKRLTDLMKKQSEIKEKQNELESQLSIKEDRISRLEEDIEGAEKKIESIKEEERNLNSTVKKKKSVVEDKKTELKGLQKKLDSMDEELEDLREKRDKKKEKKYQLKNQLDKLDSKQEAKKSYIRTLEQNRRSHMDSINDLEGGIEEHIDYSEKDIPSMKELKHRIRKAENEMERLEPVNMRALNEYKRKKERMEKLQGEYTELEERREELDHLIEELDEKKKVELLKVKEEIDKNFTEVYHELSGGEAQLELEDEDSPFDGGLIIKARPPGKKVHRIQALSGGEKSLVSMAFIFSIQRYDPSPFYLLDEIDQNLDGVNAEKVAGMIKDNSKDAQFIQISLRKATLKKSDHLVGVTMHEDGLSDIIMKLNMGTSTGSPENDLPTLSGISSLKTEVS